MIKIIAITFENGYPSKDRQHHHDRIGDKIGRVTPRVTRDHLLALIDRIGRKRGDTYLTGHFHARYICHLIHDKLMRESSWYLNSEERPLYLNWIAYFKDKLADRLLKLHKAIFERKAERENSPFLRLALSISPKMLLQMADIFIVSTITPSAHISIGLIDLARQINPYIKIVIGGYHVDGVVAEKHIYNRSYNQLLKDGNGNKRADIIYAGRADALIDGKMGLEKVIDDLINGQEKELYDTRGNSNQLIFEGPYYIHPIRWYSRLEVIDSFKKLHISRAIIAFIMYVKRFITDAPLFEVIEDSYGCGRGCSFCHNTSTKNTYIKRNINSFISEYKSLRSTRIMLTGDNPFRDPVHFEKIMDAIILDIPSKHRKMIAMQVELPFALNRSIIKKAKTAGLGAVFLGTESLNHELLKDVKKGHNEPNMYEQAFNNLHEYGLSVECGIMIGFDRQRIKDIEDMLNAVVAFKAESVSISTIQALPGTIYRIKMIEEKRIKPDNLMKWHEYWSHKMLIDPLPEAEIKQKTTIKLHIQTREFFFSPECIYYRHLQDNPIGVKSRLSSINLFLNANNLTMLNNLYFMITHSADNRDAFIKITKFVWLILQGLLGRKIKRPIFKYIPEKDDNIAKSKYSKLYEKYLGPE